MNAAAHRNSSPKRQRRRQSVSEAGSDRPGAATYFYRSRSFAAVADAYVRAYGKQADRWTTCFLLGRALELALKAILRAEGMSARALAQRRYGHNLYALVQECRARSVEVVDPEIPDSAWGLQCLSEAYSSKELEYQGRGQFSGPAGPLLRRLIHFAIGLASARALTPEVHLLLRSKIPAEPGLTLDALEAYD